MTSTIEGRLVHRHTAYSFLYATTSAADFNNSTSNNNNSNSIMQTMHSPSLRYKLAEGKKSMSAAMQKASRSTMALAMRHSSNDTATTASSSKSPTMSSDDDDYKSLSKSTMADHSATTPPSSSRKSSSSSHSAVVGSSSKTEMIKIFVLLLEPRSKTFELIQLVYPAMTTTIGGIIRMIPQHATELTLGSQTYVGLCRPKGSSSSSSSSSKASQALSDFAMLASDAAAMSTSTSTTSSSSSSKKSKKKTTAAVCTGEILVAIPKDYSVAEVSRFSHAILTNRRFTKLLRRSNPLAPKAPRTKESKSHKKDRKSSSKKSSSRDAVQILEKHEEHGSFDESNSNHQGEDEDPHGSMQKAMEKAATAAAQANASILGTPPQKGILKNSNEANQQQNHHQQQQQQQNSGKLSGFLSRTSPNGNRYATSIEHTSSNDDENNSVGSSLGTSRGSSYTNSTSTTTTSYAANSWIDGGASIYSNDGQSTIGDSISSWSKSLDASFSPSGRTAQYARHRVHRNHSNNSLHRMMMMMEPHENDHHHKHGHHHHGHHHHHGRRHRRRGGLSPLRKFALAGVSAMIVGAYLLGCYWFDPTRQPTEQTQNLQQNPMGLPGLLQVIVVLLTLKKIQFLYRRRDQQKRPKPQQQQQGDGNTNGRLMELPKSQRQSACPVVRIYAKLVGLK